MSKAKIGLELAKVKNELKKKLPQNCTIEYNFENNEVILKENNFLDNDFVFKIIEIRNDKFLIQFKDQPKKKWFTKNALEKKLKLFIELKKLKNSILSKAYYMNHIIEDPKQRIKIILSDEKARIEIFSFEGQKLANDKFLYQLKVLDLEIITTNKILFIPLEKETKEYTRERAIEMALNALVSKFSSVW